MLDDVPPPLVTDEPATQEDILRVLFAGQSGVPDSIGDFHARNPRPIPLSTLRKMNRTGSSERAMALLSQRSEIIVDDQYLIDPMHRDRAWYCARAYLDFLLMVPRGLGFAAFLPPGNQEVGAFDGIEFILHLGTPRRMWKAKYGQLGFDPTGRMLYIGTCRDEDIWLAAAPDEFGGDERIQPTTGDSRMTASKYHIWLMFLAYTLDRSGGDQVYCLSKYPNPIKDLESVKQSSNIL